MSRSLPALVLAAAVGAAVTYYLVAPHGTELIAPYPGDDAVAERATLTPPTATGIAERADIYRAAAQATGADIVSLLKAAARLPASPERSFRLGVLLARYTEVDAEKAIAAARSVGAGTDVIATLYAQWAGTNPAAALSALSAVDDAAAATKIGLALLTPLGGDDYAVRQIAAALPKAAERRFLVGAVAAVAETDPATALSQAIALKELGLAGMALQPLAAAFVEQDPRGALARAEAIDDTEFRVAFQGALFREWAQRDLDGLFDYFRKLDGDAQARVASAGALRDAARLDPLRTLELVGQLPPPLRPGIETTALSALAQRDLDSALQYLEKLPGGQQEQWVRQAVARIYGKRDPDAALAWARSTGLRETLTGVLSGIATTNAERAFDVLKTLPLADRFQAMQMIASEAGNDRSSDPGRIAEQLLGNDDPNVGSAMSNLLSSWSSWSPPKAIAWIMSHSDRLPPVAFRQVAMNLGSNDITAGEQYLAQLPSEARFAWIQGLAEGRSRADPRAAVAWVQRLRQDPAYVAAAASVAQGLARVDPQAAGDLLAGIDNVSASDAQTLSMAAWNIGSAWARTDPRAAADWARDLRTDAWRSGSLGPIVAVWAESDYSAAHSWTLRLPSGVTRDAALGSLLAVSTNNEPDAALLRAFSSDETRQNALLGAVARIAQRDPETARSMSQRYLSGPQRQQAEQMIAGAESQRRTGGLMFFSN
jgi:hypothetical protein